MRHDRHARVRFVDNVAQLPRLLHSNSSRAIPVVNARTNTTPASDLHHCPSVSVMNKVKDKELAVLRLHWREALPSMKIVFSDEPIQRERSVFALALVVQPLCPHNECISKHLWPQISARKQVWEKRKFKTKLSTGSFSGLGVSLSKEEQQFLALPRPTLLNSRGDELRIALVKKRHLEVGIIAFDSSFLSQYGLSGRVYVDRLPFDVPTDFCSQRAHMALLDKI